jgi:phosphoribosylformimino-5-aminoimidazole carboxamide ribotide isomerase
MIILPAIDILDGKCVMLFRGEYDTAEKVAADPLETARRFAESGAEYIHMVDLNGAREGSPKNAGIFINVAKNAGIPVELGGGIRNMETVDYYLQNGISRVILGSVVLTDKNFVIEAVKKYGGKIAVGIDARDRKVKTAGWLVESELDFVELAVEMEKIGVDNIIYTDIGVDGTLAGANVEHYKELKAAVNVKITASGGIVDLNDIIKLCELDLYGAICGKSIYSGSLDLKQAIDYAKDWKDCEIKKLFLKGELIPAIVQDIENGEVLQLAYMNEESFRLTLKTKRTWFYSRSQKKLWNKGETSGHYQNVKEIYYDCDADALLIKAEQVGAACHTGKRTCFFNKLI